MALAKLMILAEVGQKDLPFVPIVAAMFNPSQLTMNQSNYWHTTATAGGNSPQVEWTNAEPASLSLDLMFDTYESGLDVRIYTQRVAALMLIQPGLGRPPRCSLVWGRFGIFFQGALTNLNQTFNLFLADGTPTRATLQCQFQESTEKPLSMRLATYAQAAHAAIEGARAVTLRARETLSTLAGRAYNDPAEWRRIAEANKIDNPLKLAPGASLVIPPARRRRQR